MTRIPDGEVEELTEFLALRAGLRRPKARLAKGRLDIEFIGNRKIADIVVRRARLYATELGPMYASYMWVLAKSPRPWWERLRLKLAWWFR